MVSVASSDFTCNTGQSITCTRSAPVVVGAVYTITVVTTVLASAPAGVTTNVARVTGTEVDSNPNNNTHNVDITVTRAVIPPPFVQLPTTGSNTLHSMQAALAMIGLGGLALLFTRRRRSKVA